MGYEGRTASSTVPDEAVPRVRASGGRVKPGSKPRAATEEQVPRRRTGDGAAADAPAGPAGASERTVQIPEAVPTDAAADGAIGESGPGTEPEPAPAVEPAA